MSADQRMAHREIALDRGITAPIVEMPTVSRLRAGEGAGVTPLYVTVLLWVIALAFSAFFIYYAWLRYHTFLVHAEDLGNYEQAMWNTVHGQPFHFNNLRFPMAVDPASGTNTRLSYHVEPILLLLALPYFIHASPVNLLVMQVLVVASGVFPTAWLARRHLRSPLAQLAFPLAYLLAPPLQAATLYEFHAVTLSAALLLWALYFADGARYGLFALFAVLAMATKEEIGLIVALMGLWIWWRNRDRTVGLTTFVLGIGWSLFCVLVIMRYFGPHHHSSPFCARFNPYIMNGHTGDPNAGVKSCGGVLNIWLRHPDQVLSILFVTQKFGFLHRMLVTTGYLSLLSPLTLAISLPGFAIILLSDDIHMYSGLGHYPAELVPLLIGAAILGTAWLANRVGARLRIPPLATVTVACLWLLFSSVSNAHVNGFTPLAQGFALPPDTQHAQVGRRILSMIPPNASVSAGDYLNAHLSDRAGIYLFPDIGDARYAVVDVTQDNFPIGPSGEMGFIRSCMLTAHVLPTCPTKDSWGVVAAEDGYILMERLRDAPQLSTTLPSAFYSFALPATAPRISHPMIVNFGPLQLLGFNLERREQVNLRLPDVLLTTYWRLTGPVTSPITPVLYMTNSDGAIDYAASDQPATDWLPITQWPRGKTVTVRMIPATISTNDNGKIDVDLAVYGPGAAPSDLLSERGRYRPNVRWTPGHVPMEVVDLGTILKLAQVRVEW